MDYRDLNKLPDEEPASPSNGATEAAPLAEGNGALESGTGPALGSVDRILRNSLFHVLGHLFLAVSHLVVVFVLARSLGKDGLGQFYTIFSLIFVVQLLVEVGCSTVLTCRISQAPQKWKETVAEAVGLFTLLFVVSGVVLLGVGWVWSGWAAEPAILWRFVAAATACAAILVQRFSAGVFRAFELSGYENLARMIQGALFAGLAIILALTEWAEIETVLAGFAASHVIASLFLLVSVQKRWRCLGWRLNRAIVKSWLAQAIPLGLGDVVRRLTWQLDTILLGLLQPAAVVGIYSVAYRPLGPLNWLPNAFLAAAFPSFARLAGDRKGLDRAFSHSIRLMWIIGVPIAVTCCMCAEPLIVFLAGPDYLEAAVPLRLLIWIATLTYLSNQFGFFLVAVGAQTSFSRLVLMVFVLELGLELALIPSWSYFGACAGSLVGELFFTVAGLVLCRKLGVGRIEWRPMAVAALAGAAMAGVLWLASASSLPVLALVLALAMGLYIVLCVFFGALERDEVNRFFTILRNLFRRNIRTTQVCSTTSQGAAQQAKVHHVSTSP